MQCLRVPEEQLSTKELDLGGDLTYSERPIKSLDMAEHGTHSMLIKMCKVQWSQHMEDEGTWEHKKELRADYLELFLSAS
jgi:UDP-3-O-acyl-N-acetylglucosamine deacetylase